MTKETYSVMEKYMLDKMKDSAHDFLHIYRVLNQAMNIAKEYKEVNQDVLIASCLLHDIGRQAQFENPALCHAIEGGKMAYEFLKKIGYEEKLCLHIKDCITTHRFRTDNGPKTIEAKILFDSDKLDVTGALGIARTLMYRGRVGEPIYTVDENGQIQDRPVPDSPESFFKEYNVKLIKLYDHFYTKEARIIAQERKECMVNFYEELLREVNMNDLNEQLNLSNA